MNHNDFVVFLHKIPPEGLRLSQRIEDVGAAGIEIAVPLLGPVDVDLAVQRFGGEIHVEGKVRATLRLECARCLKAFTLPFQGAVDATFAPRAKVEGEDHELTEEDLDVEPLIGGAADLRNLIAEQIHLGLPLKPLCSAECRGLCPRCGRDLASGTCNCASPGVDPRWDALRKLAVKG